LGIKSYIAIAGRGPCGRPHPLYVIIVLSADVYECLLGADGHKGRALQQIGNDGQSIPFPQDWS
jgi:hypothetical protein